MASSAKYQAIFRAISEDNSMCINKFWKNSPTNYNLILEEKKISREK